MKPWPTDADRKSATAEYHRLVALLRENLGLELDHPLVGIAAILGFLHDTLGMRRTDGSPIPWARVRRWVRRDGFPLLPNPQAGPHFRYHSVTTMHAAIAWMLSPAAPATAAAGFAIFQHKGSPRSRAASWAGRTVPLRG